MKKFQSGQSLFELVVAVSVVGLTLVAILQLVSTSISNNTFSEDRTRATQYTQEALEWARAERDRDWGEFTAQAGTGVGNTHCIATLPADVNGLSGTECGAEEFITDTILRRQITLIYDPGIDQNSVDVRVVTSWEDSDGVHESRISTYLTNWRTN